MSYITPINLRLPARNEGKIKAYESCSDVRAWSHDTRARDRYLREWIRGDMTVCFIPASTLAKFLRIMTYKSQGKATPRCHPDCKSKVILESICASCDAMKECLKDNSGFQNYFDEEEFETSHWPCERCVEALKSIKLFWKIIVDKLFNINLIKNEVIKNEVCSRGSVKSVAKEWQEDIVQQAIFVKSLKPLWNKAPFLKYTCPLKDITNAKDKEIVGTQDKRDNNTVIMPKSVSYTITSSKATDTNRLSSSVIKKNHKQITGGLRSKRMVDKYCETCNKDNEDKELNAHKTNLLNLQQKYCAQQDEIAQLKTENNSLRMELQNIYKQFSCKRSLYSKSARLRKNKDAVASIPKPFETYAEESIDSTKETDSEMYITMKNCKDESYRHISLLQVLHKTNGPIQNEPKTKRSCCKKEDPINILTRVHNTFGDIVRREMSIANERSRRPNKTDIDAAFHSMNASRSEPSCTTTTTSSSDVIVSSSGDKKAQQ